MKKLNLLVMPLMAMSLLASCDNGGGDKPENVKFSVQETSVTVTDNTATIHLDWNPSGDIIEFSNFTFTLTNDPITTYVTPGEAGSRPLEITIMFSSDLVSNDKGTLKFHYNDKTTKKEGDAKVEDIAVEIKSGTSKSIKKIEGVFKNLYTNEELTGTFEYEYTSPTSFTITDTEYSSGSGAWVFQKHYHNIEVEENGLIKDTYILGRSSFLSANGNNNEDVMFELCEAEALIYDEEGFIVEKQTFLTEEVFLEIADGKDIIDPIIVEASFPDSNEEKFYVISETDYLRDENNNLTHELLYGFFPNAEDKIELQLYQINERRYDKANRVTSDYVAYIEDSGGSQKDCGIDYTYDANGIVLTENKDYLAFKNTTTKEFFANYVPYLTPLTEQEFDRTPEHHWICAYETATPGDYSKYSLERFSENTEETNPTSYKLEDYCDFEIKEDGSKEEIRYDFKRPTYNFDTPEFHDMAEEIESPETKYVYLDDKYGNRIINCPYDYDDGEFAIDESEHKEYHFSEDGLLESLIKFVGYGSFQSTKIEYCDTEVDYHQNPNWIFNNVCRVFLA